MRKFLKTSHVISRIFLYLCVLGILFLYFFKPGVLALMQRFVLPSADTDTWPVQALTTALSFAALMFAASELSYKGLQDNEFMITLSESVLKPVYGRYDLSDRRFSKPAKGEFDFNASLRDVTDGQERVKYELAWERQHSRKLQKKTVGNKIVTLIFFIAGLACFFCPLVVYPLARNLMPLPTGTALDIFSLVALILALVIILEIGNNQGQSRRLNTILSIRTRSDELNEKPTLPAYTAEAGYPASKPVYEAPKPAAPVGAVPEQVVTPSASVIVSAPEPVRPEESWTPEPAWTGVPEDLSTEEKPGESAFVNLTPEKESED